MDWLKAFFKGKAVLNIVVEYIPKALEDGKLTMDEITTLINKISAIFNYNIEIKVPAELTDKVLDVVKLVK